MSDHQILNFHDHAEVRVHTSAGARFGDDVMSCLITPAEFRQVQAHYPIVFRRDTETAALVLDAGCFPRMSFGIACACC